MLEVSGRVVSATVQIVREKYAKLVRVAVPTGPRKFARKMCWGIKNVERLCKISAGVHLQLSAPKSRDSLRLRWRFLPLPPKKKRAIFLGPQDVISSAKKIASEPRFLLRRKWVKMVLVAEFPPISSSAISLANRDARFWCAQICRRLAEYGGAFENAHTRTLRSFSDRF